MDQDTLAHLQELKDTLTEDLKHMEGVYGVGIGQDCLIVYLSTGFGGEIPETMEGVPVWKKNISEPVAY